MVPYKSLQMKEVIFVALITCKECGKEISDKAIACPNCGYPMKYPTPYYPDIEHTWDMDSDYYYDTKNHREISLGEYLMAESRYEKECEKNWTLQPGQIPEDVKRYIRKK